MLRKRTFIMSKTNMRICLDSNVKEEILQLGQTLNLDISTITEMFYIQVLRAQGLPFSINSDEEPNSITYKAMKEAEEGKLFGPYDTIDDLILNLKEETDS